jgi:phage gp45-like
MPKIATILNAVKKKFTGAPGDSLSVDLDMHGADDAEFYHLSGIFSKPQDGAVGVVVDAGGQNIVVASHDYRLNIVVDKGETIIYSYGSGGVVLASAKFGKDGKVVINEGSKSAVSHAELNTALQAMAAAINANLALKLDGTGQTPGTVTVDISAAEVEDVLLP